MKEFTYNKELWEELVTEGEKNQSNKEINVLNKDDIISIVSTMHFFESSEIWTRQTMFDLSIAKFRVFDWLAMCVMSRNDDNREQNNVALQILIYAFQKANYNEKKFIENLRYNDYDIIREWENIIIDIDKSLLPEGY